MFPVQYVGIHEMPVVVPEAPKVDPAELVAEFLLKFTIDVDGALIPFSDFERRFHEWSGANLSKFRISRSLPARNASGAGNRNKSFIINRAWLDKPVQRGVPLVVEGGRIKKTN